MKKILAVFIVLLSFFTLCSGNFFSSSAAEYTLGSGEAYVISSKCDIYTEASFLSAKLTIEDENVVLKHGDIVNIEQIESDFALIKKNGITGYAYKFYLSQNSSQDVYPVFNARIRNDTPIYDLDLNESGFVAKKGTRLYIYDGFKGKNEYTPIQIILDNGKLYNGFIKTAEINPDGISSLLIVGISIIAAAVTIILSLVFIQKSNKKKKGFFFKKKKAQEK